MNVFRCSSPYVQIMKVSSMNLHEMNGWGKELSMACCSNLPMNKLAYARCYPGSHSCSVLLHIMFVVEGNVHCKNHSDEITDIFSRE